MLRGSTSLHRVVLFLPLLLVLLILLEIVDGRVATATKPDHLEIHDEQVLRADPVQNFTVLWNVSFDFRVVRAVLKSWDLRRLYAFVTDNTADFKVVCLDADTGAILWSHQVLPGYPKLFYSRQQDHLFYSAYIQSISIEGLTGKIRWRYNTTFSGGSATLATFSLDHAPKLATSGEIFLVDDVEASNSSLQLILGLDARTGVLTFTTTFSKDRWLTPTSIIAPLASTSNKFFALVADSVEMRSVAFNSKTGEVEWIYGPINGTLNSDGYLGISRYAAILYVSVGNGVWALHQ
jgi:outer membrane protein assembly factor BamB